MRRVIVPLQIARTAPAFGGVVHTLQGRTMGTTWAVKAVGHRAASLDGWQRDIEAALGRVVAQMSTWDADSDLCRFNRAEPGSWVELPHAFFTVLQHGLQVALESGGAYDPAHGALVDVWGFGPAGDCRDAAFRWPDAAAVDAARARGGAQRVSLDAMTQRVQQPGGLSLDLSAIAKGFGVDEVARVLRERGVDSFLVDVGGELRGEGVKPDGQPWWVTLEAPAADADGMHETVIALHGLSVATSGDYRRFVEVDGTRYSHTIDPRDGRPIRHGVASVSVLHTEAMAADAWSTALNVLGADDGIALADRQALPALFVVRTATGFEERASRAWQALLE